MSNGIGEFKGFYSTAKGQRSISRKYANRHDVIHINVPIGTRNRIQKTGLSQQDILRDITCNWLEKKRKEINDGLNNN